MVARPAEETMPDLLPEDELDSLDAPEQIEYLVCPGDVGLRLDHFLVERITAASRSQISAAIRSGNVLVDGATSKAGYRLKAGEQVCGALLVPQAHHVQPENIPFPIIFEDDCLIVLVKPPGLVVHPGSGNASGTLVNGLVYHCQSLGLIGDPIRPGLVHRLDKDTSGIMVVAKSETAHRFLVDAFKNRQVEKEYLALVHGIINEKNGRLVAPIGRHSVHRQKMAIQPESGRYAATRWQVLAEFDRRYSLLRVVIETGRTHQIRVHLAHLGHPVVGDGLYGSQRDNRPFPRQLLHAATLTFRHPLTGETIRRNAPLWTDFQEALDRLAGGPYQCPGGRG